MAHRELLHELGLRTSTTIVSTSGEAMARECPKKGGAALSQCTMSRYFSRTVSEGGVCIVIVLKPQRYMAHCECQLNMLNSGPH